MPAPDAIAAAVDYVLRILLDDEKLYARVRPQISYEAPSAETDPAVKLCIVPSPFFGESYGTALSLPQEPLPDLDGTPLLFGEPLIERSPDRLVIHADLIASTFFLVTRYEETVREIRDAYGRFPGRESLPYRNGFLCRPVVEEYAELLRAWLRDAGLSASPAERSFTVCLTHDVDYLAKYHGVKDALRRTAGVFRNRTRAKEALQAWAVITRLARDPYDCMKAILHLDASLRERLGDERCTVLCFFIAGGTMDQDLTYRLESATAQRALSEVKRHNAQIGLHTSYEAGLKPELIRSEKEALESASGVAIHCNRHHFLGWRDMDHGRSLGDAGLSDDYTLGYADQAGFRLGVCRPIPLFDPTVFAPLPVTAHPLTLMDVTLSRTQYMDLDEEEAFACSQNIIRHTQRHNGELVMLWHNTEFERRPHQYHPSLYRRLLRHLAETAH